MTTEQWFIGRVEAILQSEWGEEDKLSLIGEHLEAYHSIKMAGEK